MNELSVLRANAAAARCAAARVAGEARHPARSRCQHEMKRASQKPFDGDPYTRLAGADQATDLIWDIDVFVSRRAIRLLPGHGASPGAYVVSIAGL